MKLGFRQKEIFLEQFFSQISPDTHEPVENSDNTVAIIGAVALGKHIIFAKLGCLIQQIIIGSLKLNCH